MFEVPFSQASRKVEFFPWKRLNSFSLLVSLLRLVQWFVWASYRVRSVLSFCFSSDGPGWERWSSCLLMLGSVFLFCFLFRWGVLHRVLLVAGRCQGLYPGDFLCRSSHWLILPRVSSLGARVLASVLLLQRLRPCSRVLRASVYALPRDRYSCLLSAGVLHALLCLKVCSWSNSGERCTPHPPTPSPSCSPWFLTLSFEL